MAASAEENSLLLKCRTGWQKEVLQRLLTTSGSERDTGKSYLKMLKWTNFYVIVLNDVLVD